MWTHAEVNEYKNCVNSKYEWLSVIISTTWEDNTSCLHKTDKETDGPSGNIHVQVQTVSHCKIYLCTGFETPNPYINVSTKSICQRLGTDQS